MERRRTVTSQNFLLVVGVLRLTNSVAQEPEGSSPHSPQPATDPCPEPAESNPQPPSQSP
jgi:hypothetical protein